AGGIILLDFVDQPEDDPARERRYSEHLACPNNHPLALDDLEPRSFSFNTPYGACGECTGLGVRKEVDPDLVIRDGEKSIRDGALAPWSSVGMGDYFLHQLASLGEVLSFSVDKPWDSLPDRAQK